MLPLQTNTEQYWIEDFELTADDLDFIYNLFLEQETPIRTPDLIKRIIQHRIEHETRALEKRVAQGEYFRPDETYAAGDMLVFPALDFQNGEVIGDRPGKNPAHGEFTVITVQLEDGTQREFASELTTEHPLSQDLTSEANLVPPEPDEIYRRYKRRLTPIVVDHLREDADCIFIAKRWFLRSLLLDVNVAHLHLAEAILDINSGGPVTTEEIANQADFGEDENPILRKLSLDYGLLNDDRFDEVGPSGQVLWFLRRLEPPEIQETISCLQYTEIDYDSAVLTEEFIDIEEKLDDERSMHQLVDDDDLEDEATITLIYPHWRSGTLPLTQRAEHLFPIAYRTPRIRITLVDALSGDEMQGWLLREASYVFGLSEYYERYQVPVGGYINVRTDPEDDTRMLLSVDTNRARSEWVKIARRENNRLRFEEGQQAVGTSLDDLILLGVDSPEDIDALATQTRQRNVPLAQIMTDLVGELAQFSPQRHVHCKTLYSAVNLLKRCPPAPIFAELSTNGRFQHAGGPYWRLA